ncbi:atrophin-1-like isoform X7 [Sparus aurata]|uniref:atrophin-1-like isoform X7 n=1 Tax=Sparus aurata TaxID=8175 RepID=UPI0011C134E3|nr:atrophin-1-like isoform X7 [Sparus aurata]
MMAVWVNSGALLLVMLTGVTYSYPAKPGSDPSSSYSGGYGAYPASAGSTSGVMYAPAASGSGPADKVATYPASYPSGGPSYPQPSVQRQPAASTYSSNSYAAAPVASGYASGSSAPSYPQPSVQRQPAASTYSSNSYAAAAPVASGYASGSSAGPSPGQPTFSQDVNWAVAPPSPLSGDGASAGPSAGQFSGPSNVSPPRPPQFQGGELNKYAQIAEYGNSESETEEQGFLPAPPPPGAQALSGEGSPSDVQPSGLDSRPAQSFYPYPYPYDYLFLTGQYPPGTVTHLSSNFEQGADNYEDTHYMRYNYPASPGVQQVKISPPAFEVPQSVQQPRQPVRQSIGGASYEPSGAATGSNWPYTAAGGYRGNKRYQ